MRKNRPMPRVVLACFAIAASTGIAACSNDQAPVGSTEQGALQVDRFDAQRAMRLAKQQVAYGQRPAGSPQLQRLAVKLRPLLPEGRFEPIPGDPGLRNIVGTLPGRRPGLVIGAHYDTLASPPGFVGANNGAAGTAVVIEVARALSALKRPSDAREIRFVLFDGEEPPARLPEDVPHFYRKGLRGSRAYVAAYPDRTAAMVLLDYVGNKGLQLPFEGSSTPSVWGQVRAAAAAVGAEGYFPPRTEQPVFDDHTPFLRADVPAVDFIDWSYAGHDISDTLDQLSPQSMDAVGETVVELVRRLDNGDWSP
jgi:glutaminyl-peptide cyclotransferase